MPSPSDDLPIYKVDDYAFTILAQKISAVTGVSQVLVAGQQDYRRARPGQSRRRSPRTASALEDVRTAHRQRHASTSPRAISRTPTSRLTLDTNDQLFNADGLPATSSSPTATARRSSCRTSASVIDATKSPRTGAWFNGKRSELLLI